MKYKAHRTTYYRVEELKSGRAGVNYNAKQFTRLSETNCLPEIKKARSFYIRFNKKIPKRRAVHIASANEAGCNFRNGKHC